MSGEGEEVGGGERRMEAKEVGLKRTKTHGCGSGRGCALRRSQTGVVRTDTCITVGGGNNIHGEGPQRGLLQEEEGKQRYGTHVKENGTSLNDTQLSDTQSKKAHFNDKHIDDTHLDGTALNDTQFSGSEQSGTQLNGPGCNGRDAKLVKFNKGLGAVEEGTVNRVRANRILGVGGGMEPRHLTVQDYVDLIHNDPHAFINGELDPPPTPKDEVKHIHPLVKEMGGESLLVTDFVERLYKDPVGFISGKSKVVAAQPAVIFGSEATKVPGLEPATDIIPSMHLLKHARSHLKTGKAEEPKPESSKPGSDKPKSTEPGSTNVEHTQPGSTKPGSHIIAVPGHVAQVTKPTTNITGDSEIRPSLPSELKAAPTESSIGTVLAVPTTDEPTQNMNENRNDGVQYYSLDGGRVLRDDIPQVGSRFMLKGSFAKLIREKLRQGRGDLAAGGWVPFG